MNSIKHTKKYVDLTLSILYAFVVFFEVMSLSAWHYLHSGFGSPNSKIVISIFVIMVILGLVSKISISKILFSAACLVIGCFYYIHLHEINYFIILLFALCAGASMDFFQILKIDFFVRGSTVLLIALLSLLHFLPISGNDSSATGNFFTKFVFGFSYPNLLGYLIVILAIEFIFLFHSIKLTRVLLFLLILLGCEFLLDYLTGVLGILIALAGYLWGKSERPFRVNFLFILSLVLMPCLISLSVYITKAYNPTNLWWDQFNRLMSLRIPIWQYYYHGWGIHFFGTRIDVNAQTLGVIGYGAFDGAYLYFLLNYGIFSLIFVWLSFFSSLLICGKQKERLILACFLITIVITSFPETLGFINAYSPIFLLIGSSYFVKTSGRRVHRSGTEHFLYFNSSHDL